ncbi:hypothetical protein [Chitinimonas sp.]|uniref:hypothetical protein n=1 Tax=Chitinimonas sp. TaxID=1934313 RepID=UPI002F955B5B
MKITALIPFALIAAATLGSASANEAYVHSHSGTPQQATNSDVNFGNPASVKSTDRNVDFKFSLDPAAKQRGLGVESHERIGFDLENPSKQAVAFVVGDEAAVAEYAQLFRQDPNSVSSDFHGVLLAPGEKKRFAWKFDTFGNPKVAMAYVTLDGEYQQRKVPVTVTRVRDR